MNTHYRLIFTTCANEAEARQLAQHLVKEKLAACVNILPTIESIYMWEGELTQATESKLRSKLNQKK